MFRKHYGSLCNDVHRLLKDESLSEDLVQEVFIKIWEKKNHVLINDRFIFYLKKSCYHAALKYLSSKSYQLETDSNEQIVTSAHTTDENMLSSELDTKIQQTLGALPQKTRLVFTLSRYDDLSYKEIALHLGVSVKAVEKHMGKALKLLKSALSEHLIPNILMIFHLLF